MICDMDDVYKNIEKYNLNKKQCIFWLIVDIISNKKLNPIVTEIFIRVEN